MVFGDELVGGGFCFVGGGAIVFGEHLYGLAQHAAGRVDFVQSQTKSLVSADAERGGIAGQGGNMTDQNLIGIGAAGIGLVAAAEERDRGRQQPGANPPHNCSRNAPRIERGTVARMYPWWIDAASFATFLPHRS